MDIMNVVENTLAQFVGLNACYYAIAAIGLNVQFGYTGLLNFGQAAFMAAGAYGLGQTVSVMGISMWWGIGLGIVYSIFLGLLMGVPTLRLRADYLAIVTIAVAEVVRLTVRSVWVRDVFGGTDGLKDFAKSFQQVGADLGIEPGQTYGWWAFKFSGQRLWVLIVGWSLVAIFGFVVWLLMRSPWGRVLKAIREDEEAVRSLGKNVYSYIEVLAAATNLKIVGRAGVGLDNVDIAAATERGVMVVNAPTSNIHSAAEHAVALLLSTARQIPAADRTLREKTWKRSSFNGTEILGKTVGVVGLGRIGQLFAQRLAAFETDIIAYDPYLPAARAAQLGIELVDIDELVARADFISVHLPKTKETAGLLNAERLAKTKDGVIIVNAARGGLIDEGALYDALVSGKVRAAGLDVFNTEPCTDSPLFDLDNVVVTPHLGASTSEAQDRAGTDVAKSVLLALAGEFVPDAVNVSGGPVGEEVAPWLELVRKLGLLAGTLSPEAVQNVQVVASGELSSENVEILGPRCAAWAVLGQQRRARHLRQRTAARRAARRDRRGREGQRSADPPQRCRGARRGRRRSRHAGRGCAHRSAAGREDRQHQRPQLRPACRGPQLHRALPGSPGCPRNTRHRSR